MDFARRDFLKLGFTHAVAAVAAAPMAMPGLQDDEQNFQVTRRMTPSILQGATDATRTQFSILHHQDNQFEVVVRSASNQLWMPDKLEVISEPGSPYVVTKAFFSGLSLGQVFFLDLLGDHDELLERREFTTLDLQKENLRFALCSCMDDGRHEPEIWQDLVDRRPDMIFFIGDSVYVDYKDDNIDKKNPVRLWKRFSEARRTLEIYYSKRLIPVLATWDDHDFGKDDSDSVSYPHVKKSQRNFLSYFAQDESHCEGLQRGPGVSSSLKIGNHLFVLMDDRSYRLPRGSSDRYAHWGQDQEQWALQQIHQHQGVTWLMNGSQIFPQMIYKESLSGEHKNQFRGFISELRRMKKKIIFASGDVHFSEISKIEADILGYQTYEVTSSSMHSRCFPGLQHIALNNRRIACTAKRNYVLVDSQASLHGAQMNVYSCSAGEGINFSRSLHI